MAELIGFSIQRVLFPVGFPAWRNAWHSNAAHGNAEHRKVNRVRHWQQCFSQLAFQLTR